VRTPVKGKIANGTNEVIGIGIGSVIHHITHVEATAATMDVSKVYPAPKKPKKIAIDARNPKSR
tara:strand:- start:544 stop:735 length:192 start_codon:yes stop_codon:yes gene_type:complete